MSNLTENLTEDDVHAGAALLQLMSAAVEVAESRPSGRNNNTGSNASLACLRTIFPRLRGESAAAAGHEWH